MKVNSNITVYPIGNVTYGDSVVVEFTDINGTNFNVTVYDSEKKTSWLHRM